MYERRDFLIVSEFHPGYVEWKQTELQGSFEDRILCANFSLSPKVTISIVGDTLNILDFRYNGKFDEWSYCNKPTGRIHGTFMAAHQHELEPERIEKYLNTNIPDCKIWDMVQARAKELYNQSQV